MPIRLLVLLLAFTTLGLVAASMGWPMVHDPPVNHYTAWRMLEGVVPFRDMFENNMPGTYLLHGAVIATIGGSDLAWRIVDLIALALTCGLITAFGRPLGTPWSAAGAALLYALFHLSAGPPDMGQRDYMIVPLLLIGAYGVARHLERPGPRWPLVAAGAAVGLAMTVKPFPVLFLAALLVAVAWPARPNAMAMIRAAWPLAAAAAVPVALIFGWLALIGGFWPFFQLIFGYTRPYYGPLWSQPFPMLFPSLLAPYVGPLGRALARFGLSEALAWWFALPAVLAGAWALAASLRGHWGPRLAVAWIGVGYGLIHYLAQAKGWEYHTYPLVAFLCVTASGLLGPAREGARGARAVGLASVVTLAAFFTAQTIVMPDRPWIDQKLQRVDALVADLKPLLGPGDRVQVMDVSMGGLHALFKLRVPHATRYVYDLQFYHPLDANVAAWRADFIRALEADLPPVMVLFQDNGVAFGFDRIDRFPALKDLLARHYDAKVEHHGYRLYVRKPA
ncbi:hypothetical protein D3C72_724010 [compost metagenome]